MVEELTPVEFERLRAAGETWQLVDVREDWEVNTASVDGAIWIPMAEIPARHEELDSATPVAVLCYSGGRSGRVAEFLDAAGYGRVANIAGGIDAWAQTADLSIPRY